MSLLVTYETVTTAANDVRTTANTLKTELDELHRRVEQVVATWEGDAQIAFHETQTQWNTSVNELTNTLQQIARALDDATDGYRATDKAAASQFRM
ncbi:WXG100 family type VII secretion target [Streptomyces zagrosensis]|uniref:ESAT-6-like protein n=1 Tax=Streptomyces zagrosensis TaxID=1042984 RepID=A0A7W9QHG5_9ACTN|nr:WXG100 family type VII secretion target [Streptomyces zagrosensis]MBB5940039.1 WXG100 family type VII secretion target [Streptomyces zagrosensis]